MVELGFDNTIHTNTVDTIIPARPLLLSRAEEVTCAAIQDKIIAASFVTNCLRIWNSLEPGAECQEYQEESCLAIKIAGDSIYMLGKDSRVRVFHMVLGRVVNEVIFTLFKILL